MTAKKALERRLYDFEEDMLKSLQHIPLEMPGEEIVSSINAQQLLIRCANKLANKYAGSDAVLRANLRRALEIKMYPATECHMSKKELDELNRTSEAIYARLRREVKKTKNSVGKDEALKLLSDATGYRVRNIFNYPK